MKPTNLIMCEGAPSTTALHVGLSFLVWASLYKVLELRLTSHRSSEWRCRVVTLIHGLVVTLLAIYSQLVEGPCMVGIEPGLPNNGTHMVTVKICLGYFIFDMSWCLYYQTEPALMMVHHCVSLFGLTLSAFTCKWGAEMVGVIGLTEVSNPLLQTRWFLKNHGYGKTLIAEIVDFLFIIIFGVCRVGVGGYSMIGYLSYPNDDIVGKLGCLAIFAISIVFYYYILGYAYKKYSKMIYGPSKSCPLSNTGPQSNGHVKTD